MPLKLPKVIGHRGAAAYAPENTLGGIHTAADMGVEWVELDVKLTKDQVPILFHDETLDRTTNGHGNVADMLFEDIRHLEAGSWFSDSFAGIKIPTLEEAVDILLEHNLGVNIEIKPCPGREKETAEVALDLLAQIWDDESKILISSFSYVSLETALDMGPYMPRGLLLPKDWPENWLELAQHLEAASVNINGNEITREELEDIIDAGYMALAYTINDPQRAKMLQGWGIDAVFSDNPDVILENLLTVH